MVRDRAAFLDPGGCPQEPREGTGQRINPRRGPQYFLWTIPKMFKGASSPPPLWRRAQPYVWALTANALQTPKSCIFHSQPWLAVPSGIISPLPSLRERDPLSGEVSFNRPAQTGGNFLHERLFTARSKSRRKLVFKLSATLHILFRGRGRIYCLVNAVHRLVSYWTSRVPSSSG